MIEKSVYKTALRNHLFSIMKRIVFISLSCFIMLIIGPTTIFSQVNFSASSVISDDNSYDSFVSIGITDMNGDGKDDVLFFDRDRILHIAYQTAPNKPFIIEQVGATPADIAWSMSVGDLDGDYIPEIVIAGFNKSASVMSRTTLEEVYSLSYTLASSSIFSQGSNMADIDGDGYLDVFICNDLGENLIYINDGTGMLEYIVDYPFDVPTNQDNSGNYASIWSDIDDDGDLDMYLAKCKQGETDPEASTRINLLHLNNGDGTYTESAALLGLDSGEQSWAADIGDIDNDGDQDLLLINHFAPHRLLIQQSDGTFIASDGFDEVLEDNFGIQGMLQDLDNNGYLDIIISGDSDYVYYNQGGDFFLRESLPFAVQDANSVAFGDLNQDGFIDAYISYYTSLGSNVNYPDATYINQGNDNHFASFSLVGEAPNTSAVGAKVICYTPSFTISRELKSGQSYGIVNSLKQVIGLGQDLQIDSVSVKWSDGTSQSHSSLDIDKHYTIYQDGCISAEAKIELTGDEVICGADSARLSVVLANDQSVVWSTGEGSDTIVVSEQGVYNANIINDDGCVVSTNNIYMQNGDANQSPIIENLDGLVACQGDVLRFSISDFDSVIWSDGDTALVKFVTDIDSLSAIAFGTCASYETDTIVLNYVDAEDFSVEADSIKKGETGLARLISNTSDSCMIRWYATATSNVIIGTGESLSIPNLESDTTVFVTKSSIIMQESKAVGIETVQSLQQYSSNNLNGGLFFDVMSDCVLESVTVTTDTPGDRLIIIRDNNDIAIYNLFVSLIEGTQIININAELTIGENYLLTTDVNQNQLSFGYNGPRLARNDQEVLYPYTLGNILSINRSNFGPDNYYSFYDWKVRLADVICESPRREVKIAVENGTSTADQEWGLSTLVYPNPTQRWLYVDIEQLDYLQLLSLDGSVAPLEWNGNNVIDLGGIPSGIYFLKMRSGDRQIVQKIIISK